MSDEIRIFISYAREDQLRVRELYDRLLAAGYHPWLDREHIRPGQQWEPIIKRALKQSHFALVCLSATSINKRGFLQKEIKQALEQALEKFEDDVWLIPARLDDCEVPDALAHIQWVDLFEEDGLQQLLAAMEYQLRKENIAPPTAEVKTIPVQVPATPPEPIRETPKPAPEPKPKREQPYSPPVKPPELKTELVNPFKPKAPARLLSAKARTGIITGALAVLAVLGYAIWPKPDGKPDSRMRPTVESTTKIPSPSPAAPPANSFTATLANGATIEMVNLSGGEFTMGGDRFEYERPRHQVKVSPFAIGKFEVTQRQWKAVMNDNPSIYHWSDDLPVENVSWTMVQDFLRRLNGQYRLPTEAEWEYAARAGSQDDYSFGNDAAQLHDYAWFLDNSDFGMQAKQTHPVGGLKPNNFGLFDMAGNVWEWCSDWYSGSYYAECQRKGVMADPRGPSAGSFRVFRGGSWGGDAVGCRSAYRGSDDPGGRYGGLGFRLVRIGR